MVDVVYKTTGELSVNYCSPDHSSMMHRHMSDELIIMDSGGSEIIAGGERYHIHAPCVIFYPRYQPHQQLHTKDEPYSRWCLSYESDALTDIVPSNSFPRSFFVFPLLDEEYRSLKPLLELMPSVPKNELETVRFRYLLAIILQQLEPLWRARFTVANAARPDVDKYIHDICYYIGEHYREPLTLDSIAGYFFISRAKLVRLFRTALDMSPNQYITNARIHSAMIRLRHGKSVQQAAFDSGFTNASYFIKVFRRYVGMTPEEFKMRGDVI